MFLLRPTAFLLLLFPHFKDQGQCVCEGGRAGERGLMHNSPLAKSMIKSLGQLVLTVYLIKNK